MPVTSFVVTGTARWAAFRSRLARLSAAFAGLSTGSGSGGKKKGRLPDGSGPQRDRTRPRPYAMRGAPSGLLLQVSPRSSRALWSNKGRQPSADGPPRQGNLRRPAGNLGTASPMPTAPATMATFLLGFRTNQTIAAPVPATTRGRAWSLPVRGWSFSLHPRRPSLRGGVKSETVVELFCRKSPGGVSHLPQRPQRSSPCLIRPPSRRGLSAAVFPAVWIPALVSLVRACGGASFAPTPRLLRASLPLRRYVRRVGVGTWPRGAVFPAFPVVHGCRLDKRLHNVNVF